MGSSPSRPALVTSLEGKSLFELTDPELHVLTTMHTWKKEEIMAASKNLNLQAIKVGSFSNDDDSPEADLAVRLHEVSPELASLRFSMVPSRIKEPLFWASVVALLDERLAEHTAKFQSTTNDEEDILLTDENDGPSTIASSGNVSNEIASLRAQLRSKDQEIATLQRKVEELQLALKAKPVGHNGMWMMDKDSQEFLLYPDEVKENMRKEKKKRLRQVEQDMKFILDSDSPEHSNGHWTCCGEKSYYSKCPKGSR